jgi:hypothetical protein
MLKELMKCCLRGFLILQVCLLSSSALWAMPIQAISPAVVALYQGHAESTASLEADPCSPAWEFLYTSFSSGPAKEASSVLPRDLTVLTAAETVPSSSTLLVIGAAMLWLAGVIRYSPRFRD